MRDFSYVVRLRRKLLFAIVLALVGPILLLLFLPSDSIQKYGWFAFLAHNRELFTGTLVALTTALFGIGALNFLQSDAPNPLSPSRSSTQFEVEQLTTRLATLSKEMSELKITRLSPADLDTIRNSLWKSISETIPDRVVRSLDERYQKFMIEAANFSVIQTRFNALSESLAVQLARQERKANLNLVIGMVIAALGFGVLGYLTLGGYTEARSQVHDLSSGVQFVVWYVPKLTFVVIIEVFSYFFLNLYRAGLGEIKYFQNEITNLESKIGALIAGVNMKDNSAIRLVLDRLSATERNFVLRKGERNVSEDVTVRPRSQLVELIVESIKAYDVQRVGKPPG